ncbi:MAG: L-aspartate oxidase [SAR92 bacterium BACL26 MAG-121220-bin70]|jgi:L-aspartate oxidase|uniref:L-aspartate oxidase n=1 Tax=SAR92 bacterium BACL26 MAG-121220-bin70 TaxID=1655626 RepID=A0A0R2U5J0_9GAMM|nr:MAG: L-aspartate oxidase [SAR92 bacterium BACL26 MAG-121220-bin70]|tara:strand:+ start:2245 stop:3861 length:1617 start_codon:yes stop_codon:yes gene_type:complete
MQQTHMYDVIIIGSGVAGLTSALQLDKNLQIALISKASLQAGASWLAQGGIAAVFDENDSPAAHVADTLVAGAGLCHEESVKFVVENGPSAVKWLIDQGVHFTRENDQQSYHLTQEGGHSHRRILHTADATGKEVTGALVAQVIAASNIDIFEQHCAVDLVTQADADSRRIRCTGAYLLDITTGFVSLFQAKSVILASGGASKAYLYTSNPDGASGDGIAMAWRKGCRVANLEFNQFHPTCLYHPKAKSFLITEALRGEGAVLRLPDGNAFMSSFHPDAELAPRDVVARAIDHEMKRLGCVCLYLDISHKSADFIIEHFPTVYKQCLEFGIDITTDPIPIVPAAHYTCGGIVVSKDGQTDLQNLYAVGENAFTGLHGANRMASNSLLECLVYAQAAAGQINQNIDHISVPNFIPEWDESRVSHSDEDVVISHNWDELRRFMWDYVGIVRTNKRLQRAQHRIKLLQKEIQEYYSHCKVTRDLLELRNLATVSELIIRCAMQRKESRGLHFTLDYPELSPIARDTIMVPINYAAQDVIIS